MEDTERVEKNINTECKAETINKIEGTSKETTNKASKEKANKEEISKEKTANKTTSKKGIKSNKKARELTPEEKQKMQALQDLTLEVIELSLIHI